MSAKTFEEMVKHVYKRVTEIESDMEAWGFEVTDMDEWTQGNYAAYLEMLNAFILLKE